MAVDEPGHDPAALDVDAIVSDLAGWSHGEQALVELIAIDRRVERMWGVGGRSEKVARAALARVRCLSR